MSTLIANRRSFLKGVGGALAWGMLSSPRLAFSQNALSSSSPAGAQNVLVTIFLRGACDALNTVIPYGDSRYFDIRPRIKLPVKGDGALIPLDSFFGIHPALAPLKPLWDNSELSFVYGFGSHSVTRSHFDAQDFMETGFPDDKSQDEGLYSRLIKSWNDQGGGESPSPLQAIALQKQLPRSLQGQHPGLAMDSVKDFLKGGQLGGGAKPFAQSFESMYQQAVGEAMRGAASDTFEALGDLRSKDPNLFEPRAPFPDTALGRHLGDISSLIKARVGLRLATTELGGFDTHVQQGSSTGNLAQRLQELSGALAAFFADLGPERQRVTVLCHTEFGRTARENGTGGTDHGHGSVAFAMGAGVKGKQVLNRWKSLKEADLYEGRDLPVVWDYRQILAEALVASRLSQNPEVLFPKGTLAGKSKSGLFT